MLALYGLATIRTRIVHAAPCSSLVGLHPSHTIPFVCHCLFISKTSNEDNQVISLVNEATLRLPNYVGVGSSSRGVSSFSSLGWPARWPDLYL